MTKHTPGPWTAVRTKYRTLVNAEDGTPVAQCESLTDADMALVAAAPDLLASLMALANAVEQYVPLADEWPELENARAAIARATR